MGSLLLLFSAGLAAQQADGERVSPLLKNVCVNGVQLHYLESGSGIPVVLIHGGLGDYREWNSQIGRISNHYRMIAYSRRYNYPNDNADILPDHSAIVEARDLAALLDALKLERVHVVGYSYGALTTIQRQRCGLRAIILPAKDRTIRCRRSSGSRWWTTFGNGRLSPPREMPSPCCSATL